MIAQKNLLYVYFETGIVDPLADVSFIHTSEKMTVVIRGCSDLYYKAGYLISQQLRF